MMTAKTLNEYKPKLDLLSSTWNVPLDQQGNDISIFAICLFFFSFKGWVRRKGINSKKGHYLYAMATNLINTHKDCIIQAK